ncbi:GNAT family N-acetyltransferase [Paenisporosarcina quisquiliarum]|uniref:GNAT family N-acetyltransferase n=1 Tax=Paenisporosarcina quisquiliarum TaxID=365346 RepID=A0A9X3LEX2_9BACL|nr:GNAT family N-acetyltransferase [Paenisporosarcina quisquiliarum]MCZ8536768.1 GNAT family N-acetyltransferase [Paenisporosarcina quisquiliarum]
MIRKLIEADRQITMNFVGQKPAENVFIIGDIEGHGFHSSIQTLWGDFNDKGDLRGVLLKYDKNFIVYAPANYDAKGFADIINKDASFSYLSGIEEMVNQLAPYIKAQPKKPRVLYYAKCETVEYLPAIPEDVHLEKAQADDAGAIIAQMKAIPQFSEGNYSVENKRESLEKGLARAYLIKENGIIVSSASSTAENSQSAMIVGVGTLPDYQKKGLATYCMSKLCRELLEENKMLCLFYDNPAAGAIYKRIGFVDIGKWCMWTY